MRHTSEACTSSRGNTICRRGIVAACGACALAFSSPAFAGYQLTDLGDIPGGANYSFAYALNNSGTVVGFGSAATTTPVMWPNGGAPQTLNGVPGNAFAAYGINNAGQIVGGGNSAFLWSPGSGYDNISANGNFYSAKDINNLGEVVGNGASATTGTVAYVWDATNGARSLMGSTVTGESAASSINDNGQITGYFQRGTSTTAYIYNPGDTSFHSLGTLSNPGFSVSYGLGINESGQVVGYSGNGADGRYGFIWSSATGMVNLGDLTGGNSYSVALGINDAGFVVGNSGAASGDKHAFIWSSTGGMVDLNSLIDDPTGFTVMEGDGINNLGQIVGFGTTASGAVHGFLLTPDALGALPEPATWAMMLLGFGGTGLAMRRSKRRTALPQLA